jgi:hypothetical protein
MLNTSSILQSVRQTAAEVVDVVHVAGPYVSEFMHGPLTQVPPVEVTATS